MTKAWRSSVKLAVPDALHSIEFPAQRSLPSERQVCVAFVPQARGRRINSHHRASGSLATGLRGGGRLFSFPQMCRDGAEDKLPCCGLAQMERPMQINLLQTLDGRVSEQSGDYRIRRRLASLQDIDLIRKVKYLHPPS